MISNFVCGLQEWIRKRPAGRVDVAESRGQVDDVVGEMERDGVEREIGVVDFCIQSSRMGVNMHSWI